MQIRGGWRPLVALIACGGCGGGAGGPPDVVAPPASACSDLTRLLLRYQNRESELCGPAEGEYRELIAAGGGYFLSRTLVVGHFELWRAGADGSFGGGPLSGKTSPRLNSSTLLIGLGGQRLMGYNQRTGSQTLHTIDLFAHFDEDPISAAIYNSGLPPVAAGRDFVGLDDGHILEWEPGTGAFHVWTFDRGSETVTPFSRTPLEGRRDFLRREHRIVALGAGRLLDWVPSRGSFAVWPFALDGGAGDPFAPEPASRGTWPALGTSHEVLVIDEGRLLIWDRETGDLEVRSFDPLAPDPLAGPSQGRARFERLRSLPRGWEPPTTSPALRRVVIVFPRGRSFDHHFGRYCRAPAGSAPACTEGPACCEAMPASIPGADACRVVDPEVDDHVPNDTSACLEAKIHGGAMDRFATPIPSLPGCGDPRDFSCLEPDAAGSLGVYHRFAAGGALADRFFQAVVGGPEANLVAFAKGAIGFDLAAQSGEAITSLLAARRVPWALYLGNPQTDIFSQAPPVFYDPRWSHFRWLDDELFHDIAESQLAPVSVIIPPDPLSEAAGKGPPARGAELLEAIAGALASSRYADDALILVAHLTSGGFYDHVPPPATPPAIVDPAGLPYGPRAPLLALGRYARTNHVSHVPLELASITRFLEWNWLGGIVGRLKGRDLVVSDICDLLVPEAACVDPR